MTDLDIAYKLNSEIVTFWQFYVAGMSGVVGWVFARDSSWPLPKRVGVVVAVVIFMIFNISGLYRTTSALHDIIVVMFADCYEAPKDVSTLSIFHAVRNRLDSGDWYMHIGPHLLVDAIIIYFVLFVARHEPIDNNFSKKGAVNRVGS
ncbi:hypothetical protein [Oceanicoccus sagamiensis]|nr:hypothetical protein [Oceanicoccus sagamiensis]